MTFLTGKHLARRTFVRGMGASMALPFLDAMVPAGRSARRILDEPGKTRLVCIEEAMGTAGSNDWGATQNLYAPATLGKNFDLDPTNVLKPLEPFQDYLTIVSNTDVRMADPYMPEEIGADHTRTTAVFLTQSHPQQTFGSASFVGTSLDQMHAQRYGRDTVLPSLELSTESVNAGGGCGKGYLCVYRDSLSWASPSEPLPAIRVPRTAFERLFGGGHTPEERAARRRADRSVMDWIAVEVAQLKRTLGAADLVAMDRYMEYVHEVERRIALIEQRNASGEPRAMPEAPPGVPDSWEEHMRVMFDLQLLALQADLTRVISFKTGLDLSNRTFPESGIPQGHHAASHHGNNKEAILLYSRINQYRISILPYFLEKLQDTVEGDTNLLDKTVILWGSAMGDPNFHNHFKCPLILLGGGNGALEGNLHLKAPDGTPMANVMLSLLNGLGHEEMRSFGDSTGKFPLSSGSIRASVPQVG